MMPQDWVGTVRKLNALCDGPVLANEPMRNHTSFKTGGPVRAYVQPNSRESLTETIHWLRNQALPMLIIGAGSNILWSDRPFAGVVLSAERALNELVFTEDGFVEAGAGVRLSRILKDAKKRNLGGFSFLVGIPGMIGGAVRMNAGTQLGSMADILSHVEIMGADGEIAWRPAEELQFAYRHSDLSPDDIVLTARFAPMGEITEEEKAALEKAKNYRKATQPLQLPSGGSVFKNPPSKAAGALIEAAGLKGRSVGGARVSELHANWIVSNGQATSTDIRTLIREIQAEVYRINDIWLEPEIRFLGPWEDDSP